MSRRWDDGRPLGRAQIAGLVVLAVALWLGLPALLAVGMTQGWW